MSGCCLLFYLLLTCWKVTCHYMHHCNQIKWRLLYSFRKECICSFLPQLKTYH